MISILAASVVGSWTYAGFLAEPTPTPTPTPAQAQTQAPSPPPASAPIAPEPAKDPKPAGSPRPESPAPPRAPTMKPSAAPPPIAPGPTLYRSTDASGQAWEHPDPSYLSNFVEARNRSFATYSLAPPATYTYASPRPYRASRCSGGRCN